MKEVKDEIGDVRKDLGDRITKGNKAALELKKRLDDNDRTFADRVTAVLAGLPGDKSGQLPTFSSSGQSSSQVTYASCFSSSQDSSDPGPWSTSVPLTG